MNKSSWGNRVISQPGDSTDGEYYDFSLANFINENYNNSKCRKEFNGTIYHYSISCILKELGYRLLQHSDVRKEYKKIKRTFVPDKLKGHYKEVEDKLREINRPLWLFSFKSRDKHLEPAGLDKVLNLLSYRDPAHKTEDWVAAFTDRKMRMEKLRNQTQYILPENGDKLKNAAAFLARVNADLKLDRDDVKYFGLIDTKGIDLSNILEREDNNNGVSHNFIQANRRNNENLKILYIKYGSFTYSNIDMSYSCQRIANDLKFLKESLINMTLINTMKKILKGKNVDNDKIKNAIRLFFGTDVKKSPAALLTNPMFFELVDKGVYKFDELTKKKAPGFTKCSRAVNLVNKKNWLYDCKCENAENMEHQEACIKAENFIDFFKCEFDIVRDWLTRVKNIPEEKLLKVRANIFNELFSDWYGIELPELNDGVIRLEPFEIKSSSSDRTANAQDSYGNSFKIKKRRLSNEHSPGPSNRQPTKKSYTQYMKGGHNYSVKL